MQLSTAESLRRRPNSIRSWIRPSALGIRPATDKIRPVLSPLTHDGGAPTPRACPAIRRRLRVWRRPDRLRHLGCAEGTHPAVGQRGKARFRDRSAATFALCKIGVIDQDFPFIVEQAYLALSASATSQKLEQFRNSVERQFSRQASFGCGPLHHRRVAAVAAIDRYSRKSAHRLPKTATAGSTAEVPTLRRCARTAKPSARPSTSLIPPRSRELPKPINVRKLPICYTTKAEYNSAPCRGLRTPQCAHRRVEFLPIQAAASRQASAFWTPARRGGQPTPAR